MGEKSFVISSLPGRGETNPYISLFYDALRPFGVELYEPPEISDEWGTNNFEEIDAIHFHWPEQVWQRAIPPKNWPKPFRFLRSHLPGAWRADRILEDLLRSDQIHGWRLRTARSAMLDRMSSFLSAARLAGVKILWTMHNAESHESLGSIDLKGFAVLARSADLIICHSENAKTSCVERYRPDCPVVVMPHGNYDGVYPPPQGREKVLRSLGLEPAIPVVGCIGMLRTYKGIDIALSAMRLLRGKCQLLCAGQPHRLDSLSEIRHQVDSTPGAVLVTKTLSDQEYSDFCNACDVILLPYRKVTGSGALLAALTLGRGVVASRLPYFTEILSDKPAAGILVSPENPEELALGIVKYLEIEPAQREEAARHLAADYAWARVVNPVIDELRLMRSRRRGQRGTDHHAARSADRPRGA